MIVIVTGVLRTVSKDLIKGLEYFEIRVQDRLEYREESWRLEKTFCHSAASKRPSANVGVKNSREKTIYKI